MHSFPSLPSELRQAQQDKIATVLEKRWLKVTEEKPEFKTYRQLNVEQIHKEFQEVDHFRKCLYFQDPDTSPRICQADYMVAQAILEKGLYRDIRNIAFDYNCLSPNYNASLVQYGNLRFIALQEPAPDQVNLFFKLLLNHEVGGLVRLKPEAECLERYSIRYWQENLDTSSQPCRIKVSTVGEEKTTRPVYIPYFTTENWADDADMPIEELYSMVQAVRQVVPGKEKMLAVHCASGVGRTGTFIAAILIADFLDRNPLENLSIEKLTLYLSIQRPNLVGTAAQYVLLYQFAAHYRNRAT